MPRSPACWRHHTGIALLAPVFGMSLACASPEVYGMDLITAYEMATGYDSEVASARASRDIEAESTRLSQSALLPSVTAGATVGYQTTDGAQTGQADYTDTAATLSLRQPLLDMAAWNDWQASKHNEESANENFRAANQALAFRTADAYFSVLRALDNLETTRRAESAFRRQWEQARERFDVGLIAITEVHESRAIYDSGQVARINAEGQLDIALESLQRITGRYLEEIHPLADNQDPEEALSAAIQNLEKTALENSPAVRAAEARLLGARENKDAREREYWPVVNLTAAAQATDNDSPFPPAGRRDDTRLALELNWPIWLGGALRASDRQAGYVLERAEQDLQTTRRNVQLQLRSLFRTVQTNFKAIQARRQETVSTESALQATRAGYDVGTRNIVEVLDAERQYYTALSNRANARYDYILNGLRLQQAVGQLAREDLVRLNKLLIDPVPVQSTLASPD